MFTMEKILVGVGLCRRIVRTQQIFAECMSTRFQMLGDCHVKGIR